MTVFKKVKTLNQIKNDLRVAKIWQEDDGCGDKPYWWCYLHAGWQWDNNKQHVIHEQTIKDVCREINENVQEWKDDPELKRQIKPHKGGRTFRPSLRLTKQEWELIKQKAYDLEMSVSDWMVYKAKNQRKTK